MAAEIREMDWDRHMGQIVQVYRNLHNGRMSLKAKVGSDWAVVGHVTDCVLVDVSFKVYEKSRQRVLEKRRRNVHAWGVGRLIAIGDDSIDAPIDLSYNPYKDLTFVERHTKRPIAACQTLVVAENLVYVSADAVGGGDVLHCTDRFRASRRTSLPSSCQLSLFNRLAA